ncbi:hypothetical protein Tco_0316690 [Tanacetum coccineum]
MPTETELTLEQTQQGVSYEVSNIRVIPFTMKMEILLELTSNKLMVDPHGFKGISKDGDGATKSKVKEIQERCIIKAFQDYQIKKGMSMSVQKSQVYEMAKFT